MSERQRYIEEFLAWLTSNGYAVGRVTQSSGGQFDQETFTHFHASEPDKLIKHHLIDME